jgi:glyoxylase-like metal-dependent hydrolase (beta-lactamase superfamily II)
MPHPVIHTIDLHFLGAKEAIAAYAIEDSDGLTLVECGPFSTHNHLLEGLKSLGFTPEDVHTLLLTHIHFDHAGAAWWWAENGVKVWVHPVGLKHMIDPTRLYDSARRIYGDKMESLWGKMEKINPEQIQAVEDLDSLTIGGFEWIAHHTPGHANHHIAWQLGDQVFTGDVGGVKIMGGPVVPPLPPPDIDLEAWKASITRLKSLSVSTFFLTHYGEVSAKGTHLDDLQRRLESYIKWVVENVKPGQKAQEVMPAFTAFVEDELRAAGLAEDGIAAYRAANPPFMSVTGILRYLMKVEGK